MGAYNTGEKMAYAAGARKAQNDREKLATEKTAAAMERIAKSMENMEDVVTRAVYNGTKDALFAHWREYQT